MSEKPKVSIITIAYNAELYIERTIKSVIMQDYPNIEYIIIDGASKDNTIKIIEKYEENINFWISEPDKSLYDAMNKGLQNATGDYVLFMNTGDSIYKKDSLSNMMNNANNADFIYGKVEYIDEEGNRKRWHKKTPLPSKISARSFLNGMVVCHQAMIVKKEITPKFKLEPWKISCDIDWTIRVMKNVKTVHFYDDIFCLYLEGGLSSKGRFQAVKERFSISVLHFGWFSAIFQQFIILSQIIRRDKVS